MAGALYQFVQAKPDRYLDTEKVWVGEARTRAGHTVPAEAERRIDQWFETYL